VKLFTLNKALFKVNNHKLAREVAYVLSTKLSYRLMMEERYMLAFNSVVLKSWDNIAVIQLTKKLNKFSNIVCVDLKEYNNDFINTQIVFMKLLMTELNIIRRG
jgi:hypothetical protein